MEIRFQPALLQEVFDSFVEKTEREGDPTYYNEFHEYADPIYDKFILEDREAEFKKCRFGMPLKSSCGRLRPFAR